MNETRIFINLSAFLSRTRFQLCQSNTFLAIKTASSITLTKTAAFPARR